MSDTRLPDPDRFDALQEQIALRREQLDRAAPFLLDACDGVASALPAGYSAHLEITGFCTVVLDAVQVASLLDARKRARGK